MSKVFITGVTGMDGSYMADYLLELGHEVYGGIRRLSSPNRKNIKKALKSPNFHEVVFDLSDPHSINQAVEKIKPDYFINLAAQSFVGSSWDIPEQTFDINATGVLRCLEAIRKHAPDCRFYNAGSSEEVGNVDYSPQDEKHPLKPRSPYGASKAAARHLVKVYRESYDLFAIQGMLYNHEAPRRGSEFVTQKIIQEAKRIMAPYNSGMTLVSNVVTPMKLGNIYAKRDWSHAKDFVKGIWAMLSQYKPEEYILASGETHTVKEFVEIIFEKLGHPMKWEGEELHEVGKVQLQGDYWATVVTISEEFYRPAEVDLLLGDASAAREALDWKPEYSFSDLVDDMIKGENNLDKR